ncbi:hypothetical protein FE782_16020 [Paenibacillus antri]|uniref:Permease n=1 Tax=Paenibacillus antri TaxID=2582848 RepID=A0A5R9GA51_9BACL|nr:hypothetical protein [Paenibacillus antri]TLS51236.1 hypothetical protein FE782_16020 [Paenibacillus antri]
MGRDAWWLTRTQWSHSKIGLVMTIAFYGTYGGMTGMFSDEWVSESFAFTGIMMDLLVLTFMSMNGFVFCKGYFNNPYWKTDSFTKKLAMMRTLPIPVETLAMSRSIQVLSASPVSTALYFGIFYIASDWARNLPVTVLLQFVLFWFALGNAFSVWFVVEEWSRSGKRYLLSSFLALFVFIAVVVAFYFLTGKHLTFFIVDAIQRPGGWLWTALAVLIGVAAHVWMQLRLRRILLHRDFE